MVNKGGYVLKNLSDVDKILTELKSTKVKCEKLKDNLGVFSIEDKIMIGELLNAIADEISSIDSIISLIINGANINRK